MAAKKNCKNCFHYKACKEGANRNGFWDIKYTERECKHFLSTADVAEVKHGEWIYHECVSSHDGAKSGFSCSECCGFVDEEIFDMDEFHKDFCGHCGAKMDGGNEDG